uniref:Uncharacterized protein n=2 Tax=unclassified Caudoviricetes TaxID=2788787 RepID=A0A8S5V961_9CAUD|nr:MAG TPA: hypothetical protein [Siphoviridae sp. ctuUw41]DAG03289.1 MAG TPA: hypothetical protein [Siphoviridae sp. ct2D011]
MFLFYHDNIHLCENENLNQENGKPIPQNHIY